MGTLAGCSVNDECPVQLTNTLLHQVQAKAMLVLALIEDKSTTVICDGERYSLFGFGQGERDLGGMRVANCVGKGLLGNAQQRLFG